MNRQFNKLNWLLPLLFLTIGLHGQTPINSGGGGIGDPSSASGNPASSYALSDFEHINYYTGSVNIDIPTLTIFGRGSVTRPISTPIQRQWTTVPFQGSYLPSSPRFSFGIYTSGYLLVNTYNSSQTSCYNSTTETFNYNQSVTVLTWTAYDGTQTVLSDTKYNGQPQDPSAGCVGADRGTVFRSKDGSGLVFVASSDVHDGDNIAFGTLIAKDGTRYIFDSSVADLFVHKIEDRNGNLIQFASQVTASSAVYTVTDPAGRTSTINATEDPIHDPQDVITYPRVNGAPRTIKVNYTLLGAADSATSLNSLAPGESVQGFESLFPELVTTQSPPFTPYVVSSIVLADGTYYAMQYNAYGELAKLTLPTGAYHTYKYAEANGQTNGNSGVILLNNNSGCNIYRPLVERDEYSDGVNLSGRLLYSASPSSSNLDQNHAERPGLLATVTFQDAVGNLLRLEKHYFSGNPASTAAVPTGSTAAFSDWWEGLEFQTEISDGTTILQSTQNVYG